jgi:hypothetical protein
VTYVTGPLLTQGSLFGKIGCRGGIPPALVAQGKLHLP